MKIKKNIKKKIDDSLKYKETLDKFNQTRISFLNGGSIEQTPTLPFESESSNTFHKRHKSVQPAFKGHLHKTNFFENEKKSLPKIEMN
jgi:hypothetical protein